jgi:tRNA A-37 threonylcarbamoyl transferase component Bud32
LSSDSSDALLGTEVIGYTLTRKIGAGGMGAVYAAENARIGRQAVVKVLLPNSDADDRLRLEGEARAANAIRHPGIIDIFGFGVLPDGREAIVMEFLEGRPLDVALDEAPGHRLPGAMVVRLLDEIADALGAAHQAGVVHRDLKPSNILLVDQPGGAPKVKVLDFGIAKRLGRADGPRTSVDVVLGTPSYMAPEQVRGEKATPSMDLYALGVLAFQLFTGRLPFEHRSLGKLLMAQQDAPPPVPSSIRPELPAEVDAFVLTLLQKDASARLPTAGAVRKALEPLRLAFPSQAQVQTKRLKPPAGPVPRAPEAPAPTQPDDALAVPRTRVAPMVVGACALAMLGGVAWWWFGTHEPDQRAVIDAGVPVVVVAAERGPEDAGLIAAVVTKPTRKLVENSAPDAAPVAKQPPVDAAKDSAPVTKKALVDNAAPLKPVVKNAAPVGKQPASLEEARNELAERLKRLGQLVRGQRRRGEHEERARRRSARAQTAHLERHDARTAQRSRGRSLRDGKPLRAVVALPPEVDWATCPRKK